MMRQFVSNQTLVCIDDKSACLMLHSASPSKLNVSVFFLYERIVTKFVAEQYKRIQHVLGSVLKFSQILGITMGLHRQIFRTDCNAVIKNSVVGHGKTDEITRNWITVFPKRLDAPVRHELFTLQHAI